MPSFDAVLIAGPTASGKSGLAVDVAKAVGGAVVNADSMQVYDTLSVLTARPEPGEMAGVEHFLYGHVAPSHAYSVAQYLEDARRVLADLRRRDVLPVFTGGTGLYFKALLEGLSEVPPIDPAVRAGIRERSSTDLPGLYAELTALDPGAATQLEPGDSQRICRALEVAVSTGKPLSWWQGRAKQPPLLGDKQCLKIVLMPDRELLRSRIASRFENMVEEGALDEVRRLVELDLPKDLPSLRAIGVAPLIRHLDGEIGLDDAVHLSVTATHQYAKRQSTWFRNQFPPENDANTECGWHHLSSTDAALELVHNRVKSAD